MRNTCGISKTTRISYFLITLTGNYLQNICFIRIWNLRCVLTHWLRMTSILFGIVTICSSLFKCSFLKNEKLFLNFLFHLWNLHQILNIFEKKIIVIANVFPRLQTVKTWLNHSLKIAVSEHPLAVNTLKVPKCFWNMHETNFIIFLDHSEGKWFAKYLAYWNLKS